MEETARLSSVSEAPPKISESKRLIKVLIGRKIVLVGFVIIFINLIAAIFAPWLAPYDPNLPVMEELPSEPSKAHLLGHGYAGQRQI